jgi:hypothetical protein
MDVFTIGAARLFISDLIVGYSLRASISASLRRTHRYETGRPEPSLQNDVIDKRAEDDEATETQR